MATSLPCTTETLTNYSNLYLYYCTTIRLQASVHTALCLQFWELILMFAGTYIHMCLQHFLKLRTARIHSEQFLQTQKILIHLHYQTQRWTHWTEVSCVMPWPWRSQIKQMKVLAASSSVLHAQIQTLYHLTISIQINTGSVYSLETWMEAAEQDHV
jgi:hypothetical protein